jgi:uncharacterized protein
LIINIKALRGLLAGLVCFGPALAVGAFTVPAFQEQPVNDYANILSADTKNMLNGALNRLWNSRGSQVAVLTVDSLAGLTIEEALIKVADQWKLGDAKKDNGVLLMIAMQEKRIRIEAGQGLEGDLPDARARRIIDEVMMPLMKEGRKDDAVLLAVDAILKLTDPGFSLDANLGRRMPARARSTGTARQTVLSMLMWVIVMLLLAGRVGCLGPVLAALLTKNLGGPRFGGGGGGFGGFSGGGGGGGGFSGGGGGFSGGGASGGW